MFSLFTKKPATRKPMLFFVNAHIGRGSNADMPANLAGAYVPVYVCANDQESALREALSQITRRGYEFLELSDGKVHQMDPGEWDVHVKTAWPEFPSHFPPQSEVLAALVPGWVVFGPFAGYESQRAWRFAQADTASLHKHTAGTACQVVCSTTGRGLTQVSAPNPSYVRGPAGTDHEDFQLSGARHKRVRNCS